MPVIPAYQRRLSIPGEAPNAAPDIGSAGIVGESIARLGQAGLHVTNEVADVLIRRSEEMRQQKQNNILIEKGALINDEFLGYEAQYKRDNKGANATGSQERVGYFTESLIKKYNIKDDEEANFKIKQHILAQDHNLKNSLATYEAGQLKNYATDVRVLDYESSLKMAQNGDIKTAAENYRKTLDTQRRDNSLSEEEYQIELKKGASGLSEAYIRGLLVTDPVRAQEAFKLLKEGLLPETQERIQGLVNAAVTKQTGMDVGTEVFRADKSGNLEGMINVIKEKKLPSDTKEIAIATIKDQWNVRKTDEARIREEAKSKVLQILNPIARERADGTNKQSDLSPEQWAELEQKNPEFASVLQDSMRRERDYLVNQRKAEERAAREEVRRVGQEKRYEQSQNESAILLDPDFARRNIDADYALKRIDTTQYLKLKKMQASAGPLNSETVKTALRRVDTGRALAESLNLDPADDAAEIAVWKNKYTDLVKAFAYAHFDEPDFDKKLSEFLETKVLGDMVTDVFLPRSLERRQKFGLAEKDVGAGVRDRAPVAGAKKADDGKWYVPDPARPGKYLKVGN